MPSILRNSAPAATTTTALFGEPRLRPSGLPLVAIHQQTGARLNATGGAGRADPLQWCRHDATGAGAATRRPPAPVGGSDDRDRCARAGPGVLRPAGVGRRLRRALGGGPRRAARARGSRAAGGSGVPKGLAGHVTRTSAPPASRGRFARIAAGVTIA